MRGRTILIAGLLGIISLALLAGCGGEGAAVPPSMVGVYRGNMAGDGTGPIRFFIGVGGRLSGNLSADPCCLGPVQITGTVAEDGRVDFRGTGCEGVIFTGEGLVEQSAPGSQVFTGSGTWQTNQGCQGTWGVTWTSRTGSITISL